MNIDVINADSSGDMIIRKDFDIILWNVEFYYDCSKCNKNIELFTGAVYLTEIEKWIFEQIQNHNQECKP